MLSENNFPESTVELDTNNNDELLPNATGIIQFVELGAKTFTLSGNIAQCRRAFWLVVAPRPTSTTITAENFPQLQQQLEIIAIWQITETIRNDHVLLNIMPYTSITHKNQQLGTGAEPPPRLQLHQLDVTPKQIQTLIDAKRFPWSGAIRRYLETLGFPSGTVFTVPGTTRGRRSEIYTVGKHQTDSSEAA